MFRSTISFATLALAVALPACSSNSSSSSTTTTANGASGQLTISGSTALLPLVKQAAQEYQTSHNNVKVSVAGGGSRVGLTQAMDKGVDIGDSDIPPAPDQSALVDHKVAVVAFAVIANPSVGVTNLTKKQIQDIFTGRISDWSQAGGKSGKITIINRPKSSGTRAVFVSSVMGNQQPTVDSLTQDSSGTVVTTVAQTPGAVSYVATGYLKKAKVTSISIDGIAPSDANVTGAKYAFWSYEHMVTNGAPSKAAADFIAYVSNDKADLHQLGFLPVSVLKTK